MKRTVKKSLKDFQQVSLNKAQLLAIKGGNDHTDSDSEDDIGIQDLVDG